MKPIRHMNRLLLTAFCCGFLLPACRESSAPLSTSTAPETGKAYDVVPERVAGLAKVEPEGGAIDIYPQVTGLIESVRAKLGDTVRSGQVLFVIDHALEEARIAVVEAQIRTGEASLRALQVKARRAELLAEGAERDYLRVKEVVEKGAGPRQALDEAETAWQSARYEIDALQADLEAAQRQVDELRATLNLARLGRDKYFIKAPADGVLLTQEATVGAAAAPIVRLAELARVGPMEVLTEIDELYAARVKVGQGAFIRLQGGRDTIAAGTVVEVSPALRQKSLFAEDIGRLEDRRVRWVRVRLETGQERVLYGQRVECVIDVSE